MKKLKNYLCPLKNYIIIESKKISSKNTHRSLLIFKVISIYAKVNIVGEKVFNG